jgi:hypothetical protein
MIYNGEEFYVSKRYDIDMDAVFSGTMFQRSKE